MNSKILDDVENRIGRERFKHCIRVGETAEKLITIHNLDIEDGYKAGLLHDCGKIKDSDKLVKSAKDYGVELNELYLNNIDLIHGPLGAKIVEKRYGIIDRDILNAIKYHTTGRKDMSDLEKVIFLADYIEPSRNFKGIENVRNIAYKDLDKAIILAIEQNIKFLLDREALISIDSIEARNQLLLK